MDAGFGFGYVRSDYVYAIMYLGGSASESLDHGNVEAAGSGLFLMGWMFRS
jgi:hypothetical protein